MPLQPLIIIILAVISFLLAKWITNYIIKLKEQNKPPNTDERLLYDQQARHIKEGLESIYIKLEEFSKEIFAKLDTKILILQNLLIDAEKKISELREITKDIQTPTHKEQKTITQNEPLDEKQQIHQKVCSLYKAGLKPQEIAKQLNLAVSEINLILALNNLSKTE
jgi:hypothetical protein